VGRRRRSGLRDWGDVRGRSLTNTDARDRRPSRETSSVRHDRHVVARRPRGWPCNPTARWRHSCLDRFHVSRVNGLNHSSHSHPAA
jgi:hypothetical protein